MRYSLGMTILSGWNYPHPIFSHIPSAEERRPLLAWARAARLRRDRSRGYLDRLVSRMSDADLRASARSVAAAGMVISGLNPYRCILVRHETARQNEEKLARSIEDLSRALDCHFLNVPLSVPFPAVWTERERAKRSSSSPAIATTPRGLRADGDRASPVSPIARRATTSS